MSTTLPPVAAVKPGSSLARSGLADFLGGLAIAAVCAGFIVASGRIPLTSPLWQWYTSPAVYPLAIGLATMLMALVVAVRGLRRWRAERAEMAWTGFANEGKRWGLPRLAWFMVLVTGLLFMLGRVPFWLSTSVFVVATVLTTSGSPGALLKPALIGVAVVYVIFVVIFQTLFGIALP